MFIYSCKSASEDFTFGGKITTNTHLHVGTDVFYSYCMQHSFLELTVPQDDQLVQTAKIDKNLKQTSLICSWGTALPRGRASESEANGEGHESIHSRVLSYLKHIHSQPLYYITVNLFLFSCLIRDMSNKID